MPVTMPGRRHRLVVQLPGRQRRQFEEGGARVEQAVDPVPHQQLAPLQVALAGPFVSALAHEGEPRPRSSATSSAIVGPAPGGRLVGRDRAGRIALAPALLSGGKSAPGGPVCSNGEICLSHPSPRSWPAFALVNPE